MAALEHPIPSEELPAPVRSAVRADAPRPARMMAARGLMPLQPGDAVTAIYVLSFDADADVRTIAEKTIASLPPVVLTSALEADLDGRVLDRIAESYVADAAILEKIVLHRKVADATLTRIASRAAERIVEIISGMDQRLMGCVPLIEAIYLNERTRASTADRVLELAVRNGLELHGIAAYREMASAIRDELISEPTDEPLPEDLVFGDVFGMGEEDDFGVLESILADSVDDEAAAAEKKEEDVLRMKDMDVKLHKLSITQKIRLATLGKSVHRSRLVRDPNKLVAVAAIKSPKITDNEVAAYAQSRSVSEDVVRYISNQREWLKSYQVKRSLALNPKCPLASSLRLLPYLRPTDLKALAKSKGIPNSLSSAAKNLLQKKQPTS